MVKVLHIAAHMGAGAGKAISGMICDTNSISSIILLEETKDKKYVDICKGKTDIIYIDNPDDICTYIDNYDVVVFNWWGHPLTVNIFNKLDKVKARFVLWSHVNGISYPYLTAEFINEFDEVMFTSPCTVKKIEGIALEKSNIIYGIGEFYPKNMVFKNNYKISNNIKIGYVGTVDFSKMNTNAPYIFSKIKSKIKNAEFFIYGRCTDEFKNNFLSVNLNLCDSVHFMGFKENIEKELLKLDVFCYPLNSENFATTENALLEAMSIGLPIVVLDNPAEREIIDNMKNGILAKNISEFIFKTVELCKNHKMRMTLGRQARNDVIRMYDTDLNREKYMTCLHKVMKRDKHLHNFSAIIGEDIFQKFLYFSGRDRVHINNLLNGEKIKLPDIYYSENKSSPKHYLRYFKENQCFYNLSYILERLRKEL